MKNIPMYRVKLDYPNSYFKVGDMLTTSDRIPSDAFGKHIDNLTGWAWVFNPEKYPEIFEYVETRKP
jgi:hypothetical protein